MPALSKVVLLASHLSCTGTIQQGCCQGQSLLFFALGHQPCLIHLMGLMTVTYSCSQSVSVTTTAHFQGGPALVWQQQSWLMMAAPASLQGSCATCPPDHVVHMHSLMASELHYHAATWPGMSLGPSRQYLQVQSQALWHSRAHERFSTSYSPACIHRQQCCW